jgi:phage N-6-adenine-methyltransferase
MQPALLRSVKTEWETPGALFAVLHWEFGFTLDVCATEDNRKCRAFFSPAEDGLKRAWSGTCWLNPPYGREIGPWLAKARLESELGSTVVCLVPARTDTAWWQSEVMHSSEIRLLKGRLTFEGAPSPAPFPSAVVIFTPGESPAPGPRLVAWDWRSAGRYVVMPFRNEGYSVER